jgi:hypothetical protein
MGCAVAVVLIVRYWPGKVALRNGVTRVREVVRPPVVKMLDDLAETIELRASLVTVDDPP